MDLKRILVGVDFETSSGSLTEGSRAAVLQALWLREHSGAGLQFLYSSYWNPEDGPREGAIEVDRAQLDDLVRTHGGDEPELIVSTEPAWIALTKRVLAKRDDLVVVAKRNRRRREDRKLGSTSLKLVRNCPSPVWVVRPDHEHRHACIVAATDLTAVGDRATEAAAFFAKVEGCALHVVHAWHVPLELQMSAGRIGDEEFAERKAEIKTKAREHIRAVPGVSELGSKAEIHLGRDTPSHAILEAVDRLQPDLVALGTISRGGLAGALVGNTAEKLIYELDCSLLVVKPADFVCPVE